MIKEEKDDFLDQALGLYFERENIGNSDIIFLDEPTAGLDVEGRIILHDEIRMLKKQGKTIIMASHDMAEVENLCDRIAILRDGKIAFIGPIEELKMQVNSNYKIHLKLSEAILFDTLTLCIYKGTYQGYSILEASNIEDGLLELLTIAKKEEVQVYDIKIEHTSLEQGFTEIAREVRYFLLLGAISICVKIVFLNYP